MEHYDVAIVGAGVVGSAIARKLSSYKLRIAILEKECDVSFGVSKANSGIIHAGFHHSPASLKGSLEVQGNLMFDKLQKELHFGFLRCGILVAAFTVEEMKSVEGMYEQGLKNGVQDMELASRDRILSLEPKLNPDVVGGLHAPSGGVIEPYRFAFSLIESAKKNGVEVKTNFEVTLAEFSEEVFTIHSSEGKRLTARYAVNAAGLYADEVSSIFGGEEFRILPRKGEEILLDRNAKGLPGKVIFPVPTSNSKGILVIPTVEGTCMIGPSAEEDVEKEDSATTKYSFDRIFSAARRLVPSVSERDIITSFVGMRPTVKGNDFFIAISERRPKLIQAAGIQSPGLTAAPAIADYVKELLKRTGLVLEERADFDAHIAKIPKIRGLSPFEMEALIDEDPAYGEIVCRCETVSEAEIVAAIRRGHTTLDGIKFYTRAQMGRCQGGFCTYRIVKLIQRETGLPIGEITKRGRGSYVVAGSLDTGVGDG
jgi:glycerol-3-phosphate dehydrogenase